MVAANKLLHLLEAFSTTWFLFSSVQNHHLVFFLLEVFNNIIQYQFDGKRLTTVWRETARVAQQVRGQNNSRLLKHLKPALAGHWS